MQFFKLMGIVPLGIGFTVLVFVWSQPFNGFGDIPVFFRLFASFVALGFILQGAALLSGQFTDPNKLKAMLERMRPDVPKNSTTDEETPKSNTELSYSCSNCGAALSPKAEVSPHGDTKCDHCGKWFNIYNRQA
ncbi:hypothetical protein KOR42_44550 [Thalassoglobus neptunius]|uniref:GATA-type domain-containing protein n=1 Tax=Thalassoglobus neptunius TaxID=1938619 RepID=A0A5C5VYN0_9PLAN|nr:zinc ribbon domain-containing protein [Thalassoglobus neptunius]TWT43514.1 hypothetical protein KOR42_44550 [Thalassoglobus neptunius]